MAEKAVQPEAPAENSELKPIPHTDLQRFEPDFLERWQKLVADASRHTRFIYGPDGVRLEERLASEAGLDGSGGRPKGGVVACANGTDAIQLALKAAGVGPGDRVLVPDATFWATFEAVVNVGAQPITVDISRDDLQMDFDLFCEAADQYEPKAAILVHLYGWGSGRLDNFRREAKERGILLIEDGAQAYGVEWQGASIYQDALISTISFYPAKVLGACGDAGAVFCSTEELAKVTRQLGNHGRTEHYGHGLVGWNSRLGGLEAAWLNLALDYMPERLRLRREAANWYRERMADVADLTVIDPPAGYTENGYLNVCTVPAGKRPALEAALKEAKIGFQNVYPKAVSHQPGAVDWIGGHVGASEAENLAQEVINLPLFPGITDDELERVARTVEAAMS